MTIFTDAAHAGYREHCGCLYCATIREDLAGPMGRTEKVFPILEPLPVDAFSAEIEASNLGAVVLQPRLPEASEARKAIPLVGGLLDYFPDALAAVAFISKVGNDKHNPGEPLHWSRGKSNDHAECIGRHLVDRGTFDKDGMRHSAYLAWRALALLQEELEAANGLPPSRGSQ